MPEPGTLAAFAGFVEANGTAELARNDELEQAVNERSPAKPDPWT